MGWPPSIAVPASDETRVRVLSFSKIMATLLPSRQRILGEDAGARGQGKGVETGATKGTFQRLVIFVLAIFHSLFELD
jgi:hypothetical protein